MQSIKSKAPKTQKNLCAYVVKKTTHNSQFTIHNS
jgi:hypothetical protein